MGTALRAGISSTVMVALVLIVATRPTPARGDYVVFDLGVLPGGNQSAGAAINAPANVAGSATTGLGDVHAVRSLRGSLGDLGTLGGHNSHGFGINAVGQVVGSSDMPDPGRPGRFITHAFETTPNGGMYDLGTLKNHVSSEALGVNIWGIATGDSSSRMLTHAFRSTAAGKLEDLGTLPGGNYSRGNAINDDGAVAGTARNALGSAHAFVYADSSGMRDLGTLPGGTTSYGLAINNLGQVAGRADNIGGDFHAFVTSVQGKMIDLGTLSGSNSSVALGLNTFGDVVGTSVSSGGSTVGFLWDPKYGMVDLNTLISTSSDWTLTEADGINAAGDITGTGTIHGLTHAFLLKNGGGHLTPTPEPRSVLLLVLGGGLCLAAALRDRRSRRFRA